MKTRSRLFLTRLKEKLKRYDFAYKYLERQLNSARSFSDFFTTQSVSSSNLDIANKIVNTLTLQVAEKDQEIIELKSELEALKTELESKKLA